MSGEAKADTVPGLGFKDKEKALETIKILNGRDPDYQKLAVKGLIGRAKRTLTLTKDKDKLQNIKNALDTFEEFLKDFENKNLSKENRAYLPLKAIESLLPLKTKYLINDTKAENFLAAYKKVKGEYKNLRTVVSKKDQPTWDIVRNAQLKKLLAHIDEEKPDLWKDDLPTKEHLEIILWAYSPDSSKIKKNITTYENKLGTEKSEDSESDSDEAGEKRKNDSSEEDESPKKKGRK